MVKKVVNQVLWAGFFLLSFHCPALSATDTLSHWKTNDATSSEKIDHGAWQNFLTKYLDTSATDGIHRIRYSSVSLADKKSLLQYLTQMQTVQVTSLNRIEQMAFWINIYNAKTISVVLEKYPIASIRDIRLSLNPLKQGPWDAELLQIEGQALSLNDIEHGILRPLWKDNRVHFALNCASLGCPNLSNLAFTSANGETLLEKGARNFIQSPRGAIFEGETLVLSSLFNWYAEDFGKDQAHRIEFISRYAQPSVMKRLNSFQGKIRYQYDWNLNSAENE